MENLGRTDTCPSGKRPMFVDAKLKGHRDGVSMNIGANLGSGEEAERVDEPSVFAFKVQREIEDLTK
jgi:hypothetical protein